MRRLRIVPAAGLAVLAIVLAAAVLMRGGRLSGPGAAHGPLPAVGAPGDAGLQWRECAVAGDEAEWGRSSGCFEDGLPVLTEEERNQRAEATERGHRLQIGPDSYETTEVDLPLGMNGLYLLTRNGLLQQVFLGQFTTYSPNHSLQNIDGKAVWECAAQGRQTVVVDGADVRRLYGLDAAYAPYGLGGRLIFIGQKAGKRFVVYDGARVGPAFDEILIAYCCEPAAYSARGGGGRYAFYGLRQGQRWAVEIALAGPQDPARAGAEPG